MRLTRIILVFTIAAFVMGCGGKGRAEKRAHQANEKVSTERLKLVDESRGCIKKAGEDVQRVEACDTYLRAAEALK